MFQFNKTDHRNLFRVPFHQKMAQLLHGKLVFKCFLSLKLTAHFLLLFLHEITHTDSGGVEDKRATVKILYGLRTDIILKSGM